MIPVYFMRRSTDPAIDNYAKDDRPEEVWFLYSFYHDALRSNLLCLVSYEARIHKLAQSGLPKYLSLIENLYELRQQSC